MIYNYRRGVDRELKRNVIRGGSLLTPLIAVAFLLVSLFSFSTNQGEGQSPIIPVKKPSQSEGQSKLPNLSLTNPKASPKTTPASGSSAKPAMSFRSLSSPVTTSPAPAVASLPGLGGGGITSGSGGSTSPGTGGGGSGDSGKGPSGSSTSTSTVVCSNLLSVTQLCTVCTPPLTLQPGQKALLSRDGTCTTIN